MACHQLGWVLPIYHNKPRPDEQLVPGNRSPLYQWRTDKHHSIRGFTRKILSTPAALGDSLWDTLTPPGSRGKPGPDTLVLPLRFPSPRTLSKRKTLWPILFG